MHWNCFCDHVLEESYNQIQWSDCSWNEGATWRHLSLSTIFRGRHCSTPFPSFDATDENVRPSRTQSSKRASSFVGVGLELPYRKEGEIKGSIIIARSVIFNILCHKIVTGAQDDILIRPLSSDRFSTSICSSAIGHIGVREGESSLWSVNVMFLV